MKYSKLFGKTQKETPKDIALISHRLLQRAGFIRESAAGRYYLLPLGIRVQQKIKKIIKEEMDKAGAQEMITPVLHPISLWKETNRTDSVGFELMKVKDRNEMEFVLGGTAEEMLVDLVRKFQISYKDLPFHLYQFSTKFRDELRARGGLLRVREFTMKDGYSFHATEEDFKKEYKKMMDVYIKIFERFGLKAIPVESDNGYIGGEYCHELIVECDSGESKFLVTEDGKYAAHEDVARFYRDSKNLEEKAEKLEEVDAVRGSTMEDGVKLHKKPLWQQIKNVMYIGDNNQLIVAVIRGDLDVNEVKLLHAAKTYQLKPATEDEIRKAGSEPGFISPIGIKNVKIIGDLSLRTIKNGYTGGNKKNKDYINVNIDRDYTLDIEADIALAKEGFLSEDKKELKARRGIEVGNIFQLGFHYSKKMKDATFTDKKGQKKPYYMGCYGIGIERNIAAVTEVSNDEKGIVWPKEVAPYQVHLIGLNKKADEVYEKLLEKGIEVLYDDREVSAGEKFADCDLIGIPIRLVVSDKTKDKIEFKERTKKETELLSLEEVIKKA